MGGDHNAKRYVVPRKVVANAAMTTACLTITITILLPSTTTALGIRVVALQSSFTDFGAEESFIADQLFVRYWIDEYHLTIHKVLITAVMRKKMYVFTA
jgi:uncharacterized membrane protein